MLVPSGGTSERFQQRDVSLTSHHTFSKIFSIIEAMIFDSHLFSFWMLLCFHDEVTIALRPTRKTRLTTLLRFLLNEYSLLCNSASPTAIHTLPVWSIPPSLLPLRSPVAKKVAFFAKAPATFVPASYPQFVFLFSRTCVPFTTTPVLVPCPAPYAHRSAGSPFLELPLVAAEQPVAVHISSCSNGNPCPAPPPRRPEPFIRNLLRASALPCLGSPRSSRSTPTHYCLTSPPRRK